MKNGSGPQICSMHDVSENVFKISEVTLQGKLGNRPMRGKEKKKQGCGAAGPQGQLRAMGISKDASTMEYTGDQCALGEIENLR